MKILHVIPDLARTSGGPVSAIIGLTKAQKFQGHHVEIITTDYGSPDITNISAIVSLAHCVFNRWRYSPDLKKKLYEKIKNSDIVHIHTIWDYPSLLACRICKKIKKPYIIRPCGMLDKWSLDQSMIKKRIYLKLFSQVLFQPGSIIHFTTEAEKEKSSYPKNIKTIVMPNGIADDAFSESEVDLEFFEKYPKLKNKNIVLFLGRVDPKKQPDLVIKAFSEIVTIDDSLHLFIAGPCNEPYKKTLEKIISDCNLKDRVTLAGMITGKTVHAAYRAASVYVLPSQQENFGISVVEAMAGYCPVIISDQVDIMEYILKGNAGLVCSNNVNEFANAIKKIITNPKIGKEMGKNGRGIAEELFTWERAAKQLEQTYSALLNKQILDTRCHGNDDLKSDDSTSL